MLYHAIESNIEITQISEKTEPSNYSYHLLIQEKDEIDKRYQNI